MIDHMSIQVADMAATTGFYDTVLAALGGRRIMDFGEDAVAYGSEQPVFWAGPRHRRPAA